MYHKRRVETTRNALCGKIPESELDYTPFLGQSTPCTDQGGASARLSEVKNESRRDFTPTPH